jgi:hypothetical protein
MAHRGEHGSGVAACAAGLRIDVAGRAALPERGQQHAALEHEPLGEGCLGQPGEEALQDVELDQFVDRAPVLAGLPAQAQVGLSGDGGAGRCRHSSTARAWRSAGSA